MKAAFKKPYLHLHGSQFQIESYEALDAAEYGLLNIEADCKQHINEARQAFIDGMQRDYIFFFDELEKEINAATTKEHLQTLVKRIERLRLFGLSDYIFQSKSYRFPRLRWFDESPQDHWFYSEACGIVCDLIAIGEHKIDTILTSLAAHA